jgi:hypothetical protein
MADVFLSVLAVFGMAGIALMVVGYGAIAALLPALLILGAVAPWVDRAGALPSDVSRVTKPTPPEPTPDEAALARKTA